MNKKQNNMLFKKTVALFLIFLCLFSTQTLSFADELVLSSPSAILIESQTGQVLFEKNANEKLPPASVTKIMTMLLVIEAVDSGVLKMNDMVACTDEAASMGGSQIYLEPGEEMTVHDLLKAVAVASGNDAAVALACHIAGSHESFVEKMNERAKELGMENTNFKNCNGLDDPEHYTTARDISIMSKELISHPKILEFTSIWMDSLRNGEFGLVNTNKLIRFYEGANGLKTGSTSVAKYCLSASAKRNDLNLIAVVLAAPTTKERFADATKLLDYGFANYAVAKSLVTNEDLSEIKVLKGTKSTVKPGAKEDFGVLVSKEKLKNIEKKLSLPDSVSAPIQKGQKIGEIEFFIDGEKVGSTEIVAIENIKKINPFQMFTRIADKMIFG